MACRNFRFSPVCLLVTVLTILGGPTLTRAGAISTYQYATDGMILNGAGVHSISLSTNFNTSSTTVPGVFNLGTFSTGPLLPGETDTYQGTPFSIDLKVAPSNPTLPYFGGFFSAPLAYDYQINGVLNGSIRSDGTSTLFPSITSVTGSGSSPAPFPAEDLKVDLPLIVAPSTNGYYEGTTTLTASVSVDANGNPLPAPAPEPTSVAAFAAALAGWAWKRRRSRSRNASV